MFYDGFVEKCLFYIIAIYHNFTELLYHEHKIALKTLCRQN